MLDVSEIVKVVRFCIKNKCEGIVSAIMVNPTQIPDYRNHCKNMLDICLNNLNTRYANEICKEFYKNFDTVPKESFCPFGVKIKYDCITVESKRICVYTQIEYNPDTIKKILVQDLPRQAKKDVENAISSTRNTNKKVAENNHDYYLKVLKTLLDGRISLSMRGLTHVLFTPLQGAMADLDNIFRESNETESLKRLEKNLNAINNYVQQIRMLTSDDTQSTPNMFRDVYPHNCLTSATLAV